MEKHDRNNVVFPPMECECYPLTTKPIIEMFRQFNNLSSLCMFKTQLLYPFSTCLEISDHANMKKRTYNTPQAAFVLSYTDILETTLPVGGSGDYTDSGDDDGGGLVKDYDFNFDEEDWDEESLWE